MAKISVEFDTKNKTLVVVMDGKTIENVKSADFFKSFDGDDFRGVITTVEDLTDDSAVKIVQISAKDGINTKTVPSHNAVSKLTKILKSNTDGEAKISIYDKSIEPSKLSKVLANKLFPSKVV